MAGYSQYLDWEWLGYVVFMAISSAIYCWSAQSVSQRLIAGAVGVAAILILTVVTIWAKEFQLALTGFYVLGTVWEFLTVFQTERREPGFPSSGAMDEKDAE